ncbi:MAG: FUSC family protein [Frankiales bacterium]|nr:FUSC family protein [Frankiales bacterium]
MSTGLSLVKATFALDRSKVDATTGLRLAVGVALPLLIGLLLHRPLDGAAAAGGAFFAGFAAFTVGYRARVRSVLLATLAVALSTFVGAAVGQEPLLLVPAVAVWGFAAGLAVSLGIGPGIIGTQAVIGLLVITQYSMPLQDAAGRAGLVAAGGLGQALLIVALWPLRRAPVERRALAAVYRSLAAYALVLAQGHAAPPDSAPLGSARMALADPQPWGDGAAAYSALLEQAERLRTTLAALGHARASLAQVAHRTAAVQALDTLAAEAAAVLTAVAAAAEQPRSTDRRAGLASADDADRWARMEAEIDHLMRAAAAAGPARAHLGPSLLTEVQGRATDLMDSLRAVVRLEPSGPVPAPRGRLTTDARATLRANLTLHSSALRHALRLAVTLALGTALAARLPFEHRYWLPLTAMVVLRPDFSSTFTRGLSRILGTAAGAVLASALVVALEPGPVLLAMLIVTTAFLGYTVIFANYALYGLAVTGFVVFLIGLTGLPGSTAVVDRVEATVLGGALALLAYAVWPTWERVRVNEQLARLLLAQASYASALLRQYACATVDLGVVQELRAAARLARTNAEASVARVLEEPGQYRAGPVVALGAAARRYALAALALQAHLPQVSVSRAPAELEALADELERSAHGLAGALREGRAVEQLPALRTAQERLRSRLREHSDDLDAAVLDVEVEVLVDALEQVATQLAGTPPVRRRGRRRPAPARGGAGGRARR